MNKHLYWGGVTDTFRAMRHSVGQSGHDAFSAVSPAVHACWWYPAGSLRQIFQLLIGIAYRDRVDDDAGVVDFVECVLD